MIPGGRARPQWQGQVRARRTWRRDKSARPARTRSVGGRLAGLDGVRRQGGARLLAALVKHLGATGHPAAYWFAVPYEQPPDSGEIGDATAGPRKTWV